MPQAIPFLKVLAVKLLTSKAIGYVIARTLLTNFALSKLSKALAPDSGSNGPPPINVSLRGTVEDRRLVFGTVRTGGVLSFWGTSGTNNLYLWYVAVLAGHQVSDIRDVWLDTIRIPDADINAGTGAVTAGVFSGKCNIWRHLGTGAQAVDSNLDSAFSEITSNHRFRGCALLVVRMERSDTAFPNGAPQSATALVDGALLYDPRLDSTNGGSGSHRAADPSTWAFSRNPALIGRWVISGGSVVNDQSTRLIRYGVGESDARIDDAFFRAAANVCDETLSGGNAPPSGSQTRYLCDIEFADGPTGQTPREMLLEIAATMAGDFYPVRGKWRVTAGDYETPTHTLTQDDIYGEIESQDVSSADERYNAVAPIYVDAAKQYVEQTGIFRTSATYETQDGEFKPKELRVRGCSNVYQAQRLAEIDLRRSREMRTIRFAGSRDMLKIAPFESFSLSVARWGWSSRVFQLLERQFDFGEEAGRVIITARQRYSGTFTDLVTADYTTGTSANDTRQVETPDPPTGLTATSFPQAIRFDVTLPAVFQAGSRVEIYEHTANTPFSSAVLLGVYASNVITIPKRDTTTRYYWVKIRGTAGGLSSEYPSGNGVAGVAALVIFDDINPNAASETYTADAAGPTTVTATAGGGAISAWIASYVYAASEASTAIIRVVCDIESADGSGDTTPIYVSARGARLSTPFTTVDVQQRPEPGSIKTVTAQATMTLNKAVSYELGLYVSATDNGITDNVATVRRASVVIQVHKR